VRASSSCRLLFVFLTDDMMAALKGLRHLKTWAPHPKLSGSFLKELPLLESHVNSANVNLYAAALQHFINSKKGLRALSDDSYLSPDEMYNLPSWKRIALVSPAMCHGRPPVSFTPLGVPLGCAELTLKPSIPWPGFAQLVFPWGCQHFVGGRCHAHNFREWRGFAAALMHRTVAVFYWTGQCIYDIRKFEGTVRHYS
jgi:hypothetical protein